MVAFDRWALSALIGLSVLACTVDLDGQCNDNADCPNGQVCSLGGCVVGAEDPPDSGPMDAEVDGPTPDMQLDAMVEPPTDRGLDIALDMPLDAAPDMPLDAGFDLGPDMAAPTVTLLSPPTNVPIVVTQRMGIGPQHLDFNFSAPVQDPKLLLTLTESNCEVDAQSSLDIEPSGDPRSGMANLTNATAVNWDCVARFSSRVVFLVGGVSRELPGPPIIIDHQPPEFLSDNSQVWPTPGGGHQILLRAGEGDTVELFQGACTTQHGSPPGDPINPRAQAAGWQAYPANTPLSHALLLTDALGNMRCVGQVLEPPALVETHDRQCSPGSALRQPLTTRGTPALHPTNACPERMLNVRQGHRPVLQGRCSPCVEFVRFENGAEAVYAKVEPQVVAPGSGPGFGSFDIALPGFDPVSHAVMDGRLFIGGAGGQIANVALNGNTAPGHLTTRTIANIPIHLVATPGMDPALYVGNFNATRPGSHSGAISRCDESMNECVTVATADGEVADMVLADVDGDGGQDVITCNSNGTFTIIVGGREIEGPIFAGNCRTIVAGRLRPGLSDTLVALINAPGGAGTIRAFDWDGANWTSVASPPTVNAMVLGDVDLDGLDDLHAAIGADGSRIHRVRVDEDALRIVQPDIWGTNQNVIDLALGDLSPDGRPTLMGVDGSQGGDGRLFYRYNQAFLRPPIEARQLHLLKPESSDLIVYQHGKVMLLWPTRPARPAPFREPLQSTPGKLLIGGFDLNGDHIDEVAWAIPTGQSHTLEISQLINGEWSALDMHGNPGALAGMRVVPADLNNDGALELLLVGRADGALEIYRVERSEQGVLTRPVRSIMTDESPLDIEAFLDVIYLISSAQDSTSLRKVEPSPTAAADLPANDVAVIQHDGEFVAAGCSNEQPSELLLLDLALNGTDPIAINIAEDNIPDENRTCNAVAAVDNGGEISPRLLIATESQGTITLQSASTSPLLFNGGEALPGATSVETMHIADVTGDLLEDVLVVGGRAEVPEALHLFAVDAAGNLTSIAGPIRPPQLADNADLRVATGDFNGDGLPDVLVQSAQPSDAGQPILHTWLMAGATQ